MRALEPFEPAPRLAIGVSGGPDSMALALLAAAWAGGRGGAVTALVVDHGLRPESGAEAAQALDRLAARGIAGRILPLDGLRHGPALAERARAARLAALTGACAAAGIVHLLLGHHAADQAETVLIRALAGSGPAGLAGIAALREAATVRILHPLLGVAPARLRDHLRRHAMDWADDPSNRDPGARRARLRALRLDPGGTGAATTALAAAARAAGTHRARRDAEIAAWLARHAAIHPEGYARLTGAPFDPDALGQLIRALTGAAHAPPTAALAALAAHPRAATLGGARLLPARRPGAGWLLAREAAAMAAPVAARPGAVWDNRFRLACHADLPAGTTLGALGAQAAALRRLSRLPAAILATLPALRLGETLFAVPHIGYRAVDNSVSPVLWFAPPVPAAGAPFVPAPPPPSCA